MSWSNCRGNTTYQSLLSLSASSLLWCSKFPNPVGCQHPERRNLCSKGAEGGSPVSWGLVLHGGLHCNPLQREVWEHLLNWGPEWGPEPPRSSCLDRAFPSPASLGAFVLEPWLRSAASRDGRGHRGLSGELSEIIVLLPSCAVRGGDVKLSVKAGCEQGWTVVLGPLQPTSSNF